MLSKKLWSVDHELPDGTRVPLCRDVSLREATDSVANSLREADRQLLAASVKRDSNSRIDTK